MVERLLFGALMECDTVVGLMGSETTKDRFPYRSAESLQVRLSPFCDETVYSYRGRSSLRW